MITVKNITRGWEHVVKPTVFPDGTIQVWNLPQEILEVGRMQIIWHYENDGEIVALLQLKHLLSEYNKYSIELVIPFLPYGRQDKIIGNDRTFGLHTFLMILKSFGFQNVITYDAHNAKVLGVNVKSEPVDKQIREAIQNSGCDLVCFPDKGATNRGYSLVYGENDEFITPSFNLDKKRNQSTGIIEGLVCSLPLDLKGKTILIVDDLCDGGGTFIGAAKILHELGAEAVDLYCTHGILSKGVHVLTETGKIRHIYITDSYKTKASLTDKVTVLKLEI